MTSPSLAARWRLSLLDRLERPVDREARGDQDRGVHPGDRDRQLDTGRGGQRPSLATTRRKKYEAKNAPNSITSETMKSRIPRVWRSIRELWLASGG